MSAAKKISLVIYLVLAVLGVTLSDIPAGQWSLRILGILAIAHSIEVAVFFKFCREAGGSLAGHLVNVFLFGILHVREVKMAQASA